MKATNLMQACNQSNTCITIGLPDKPKPHIVSNHSKGDEPSCNIEPHLKQLPNRKRQLTSQAEYTRTQCCVEYLIVNFHIVAFK